MLELSTKYAIKALLAISRRPTEEFLQVKLLSDETNIPGPYLSKIIKQLAAKGLVDTRRGLSGGVRAIKRKKPITFYEVCEALDDPIIYQHCFFSRHPCNLSSPCGMHANWSKLKGNITDFLQRSKIG